MIVLSRSLAIPIVLIALAFLPTAANAQRTPESSAKPALGATAAGEEAASAVDPAVLDQCRQRADAQKLKEGPERKAFMGTCVTPED